MRLAKGPWRWSWRPQAPAAQHVEPFVFFGRLRRTAADGAPVLLWRAGQADYTGFVREQLVPAMLEHGDVLRISVTFKAFSRILRNLKGFLKDF